MPWALRQAAPTLFAALVLAALALGLLGLPGGCASYTVRPSHIEGAGAVELERCKVLTDGTVLANTCEQLFATRFAVEAQTVEAEDGAPELAECVRVDRLEAMGLAFVAGIIPHLSDERCEGSPLTPFPGADAQ